MSPVWIAGFFEADGCVMTHGAGKGNPQPTISFTQKDPHNLEQIQLVVGGRLSRDGRGYYRLRITDREGVRQFCRAVYPHMVNPRSREQVRLAYQLGGLVGSVGGVITQKNRQTRMAIHHRIKELKSV